MNTAAAAQHVEWWTVRECANRWRVSASTVTRWLEAKKLQGKRFGSQWRVSTPAIAEFEADGIPKGRPGQEQRGKARDWDAAPQFV